MLAFLYLNIIGAICVSFSSANNVMFSAASGNTFTQTTSCFSVTILVLHLKLCSGIS